MKLIFIRHAPAGDKKKFAETGRSDAERPLTKEGIKKFKSGAKGLSRVVPEIDLIVTSPFARARQTADILHWRYADAVLIKEPNLAPDGSFETLIGWIRKQKKSASIALIGHEPHISRFMSWLLTGSQNSVFDFKKGAAALIEFKTRAAAGKGKLLWSLKPSQLRALGA